MKIFFEGYDYPQDLIDKFFNTKHIRALVGRGCQGGSVTKNSKRINGVGYLLDTTTEEHVFVLPKIFVHNNTAFNGIVIPETEPLDDTAEFRNQLSSKWPKDLLEALPLYLYQAIEKYRKQATKDTTEEDLSRQIITSKNGEDELTLLDITLSLLQFYKENNDLFVMVFKQAHSGFNKIQWGKTVRKSAPIIGEEDVVYPFVVNKKKSINYDEELLILFFNTLRYLNLKYHFRFIVDQPYNLMPDGEFKRKLDRGVILKRLKAIKNNYFNERLVRLWDLLYAFASKLSKIRQSHQKEDYLFVRKFENVFEGMIDAILSDSDLPPYLKVQRDGKIIDHLFKGNSIITATKELYYIGDSKYYDDWQTLDKLSIYKQYTYAKNVIQTEIDWFYENHDHLKYRDELTEGYNISPNFFISGLVKPGFDFSKDHLAFSRDAFGKPMKGAFRRSFQFPNRIFDRDSLFLMHFDVNLLFVLYAYVSRSQRIRSDFKTKVKTSFKREFIQCIEEDYDFYLLKVKNGFTISDALERHFHLLNGKIFCPYPKGHQFYGLIIMGLERKDFLANLDLILKIQSTFIIKEYHLGTEPYVYYMGLLNGIETSRKLIHKEGLQDVLKEHRQESVILVDYDSACSPEVAESSKTVPVRLADLQANCSDKNWQRIFTSAYIFLYNPSHPHEQVAGYILTGTQKYDPSTDKLAFDIIPMRLGGSLDLSDVIHRKTNGTNVGAFFLRFDEASIDFYSHLASS